MIPEPVNSEIISENVLIIHESLKLSITLREFIVIKQWFSKDKTTQASATVVFRWHISFHLAGASQGL